VDIFRAFDKFWESVDELFDTARKEMKDAERELKDVPPGGHKVSEETTTETYSNGTTKITKVTKTWYRKS